MFFEIWPKFMPESRHFPAVKPQKQKITAVKVIKVDKSH